MGVAGSGPLLESRVQDLRAKWMAQVVLQGAGMRQHVRAKICGSIAVAAWAVVVLRGAPAGTWQIALNSTEGLVPHGVLASVATHKGRQAVRVVEDPKVTTAEGYAIVPGPTLQDGSIEVELAGQPGAGADQGARGFVGIAFRVRSDHSAFECFYLRPTNGRADDQLRRNHSTQYISFPGFPWEKLRQETPGVYESYVDLLPSEWTHVRITFQDRRARLFVNRSPQPVLIVNDLKQAPTSGGVALWIGAGTEAFFRNLTVTSGAPATE
jgi:hypothetical protein